jgi:hypothetical protein
MHTNKRVAKEYPCACSSVKVRGDTKVAQNIVTPNLTGFKVSSPVIVAARVCFLGDTIRRVSCDFMGLNWSFKKCLYSLSQYSSYAPMKS